MSVNISSYSTMFRHIILTIKFSWNILFCNVSFDGVYQFPCYVTVSTALMAEPFPIFQAPTLHISLFCLYCVFPLSKNTVGFHQFVVSEEEKIPHKKKMLSWDCYRTFTTYFKHNGNWEPFPSILIIFSNVYEFFFMCMEKRRLWWKIHNILKSTSCIVNKHNLVSDW